MNLSTTTTTQAATVQPIILEGMGPMEHGTIVCGIKLPKEALTTVTMGTNQIKVYFSAHSK